MIEVLVTSGLACAFCGIWWKTHIKNKKFFNLSNQTDTMLDEFMKLNDIEYVDVQLFDIADIPELKKKSLDGRIADLVAKEITEKGYDFFRMRMPKGYNTLNHRHNYSDEFFYVLSGSVSVYHNNGSTEYLEEGEYAFIMKSDFHNLVARSDADVIVIAKPSLIRRV